MHIGVLTHNYPRFPGDFSGIFVEALCEELVTQRQDVTIWAPYDPAYQRPLNGTVRLQLYRYVWPRHLHRLGYMRSMESDLALRFDSYLLGPAMLSSAVGTILRQARRQRPDVLHAHWLLPNGFVGAIVSRILGIPLVVSVPGSDALIAKQNALFRNMARFVFNQADLLTANSVALRDSIVEIGADPAKFDMIIYGTDPNALRPDPTGVTELRTRLKIPDEDVIFLVVGRMVVKKGFDIFLRALASPALQNRHITAVLVGQGDEWLVWQQLGAELGLAERLRWVGNVPINEIAIYYNLADGLVMPSVSKPADGLNVCVLDAMSCGKPVVGSNVAGNPLAIVDGKTGLIVAEQDADALASALIHLVDDSDLRRRMGRASRARIENELGWPHLAQRYIEHFGRLRGRAAVL